MSYRPREGEIREHIAIALELCARYGLPPELVTREGAIEAIIKNRPSALAGRRYAKRMGHSMAEKVDSDIAGVLSVVV